jgi:hypothetical protein
MVSRKVSFSAKNKFLVVYFTVLYLTDYMQLNAKMLNNDLEIISKEVRVVLASAWKE